MAIELVKDDSKMETDETVQDQEREMTAELLNAYIQHNFELIQRSVSLIEPRLTAKALRSLPALRKKVSDKPGMLASVIRHNYPKDCPAAKQLIAYLGNPTETLITASSSSSSPPVTSTASTGEQNGTQTPPTAAKKQQQPKSILPEQDVYVSLLVLLFLIDHIQYEQAKEHAEHLLEYVLKVNRRSMDQLAAKGYFFWVRLHELSGLDTAPLRVPLLAAQRTASLRHDDDLLATVLCLLLRNYIQHNLYDQADRLISKTTFPSSTAGNAQLARWNYYFGRIRAIQLNYTDAHNNLQQAIRRAPDAKTAPGFIQTASKLSVVVELLMGDIPDRSVFRQPVLRTALVPYLQIVQAVRVGDLEQFNSTLAEHSRTFIKDGNNSLILRLRHNVIKTALRTISLAYSRIPLRDVASKLHLDSEEDAEYIVAKAIRDGVIEAVIDHENGFMRSSEHGDVYSTNEPQNVFDTRIKFLLDLHTESVKAMRFPLNKHAKELASTAEAMERERELVNEINEADDDDLGGPGGDIDGF